MNSNMVKPEKFDHLHLVYHFTIPLIVELERNLIPVLKDHLSCCYRNVGGTFYFIKNGSLERVLSVLNNFHSFISPVILCKKIAKP